MTSLQLSAGRARSPLSPRVPKDRKSVREGRTTPPTFGDVVIVLRNTIPTHYLATGAVDSARSPHDTMATARIMGG